MEETTIETVASNGSIFFIFQHIAKKSLIPLQQLYAFSVKSMRFEISMSLYWLMLKESNQFVSWNTFDGNDIIPIRYSSERKKLQFLPVPHVEYQSVYPLDDIPKPNQFIS
jgi:hypothetical protein